MSRAPRAARSAGWQSRAAALAGELAPDPSWTLSASEIGAYAFYPQAWFLQRCRLPVTAETAARRAMSDRVRAWCLRHAESEANAEVPGAIEDCGLTQLGRSQAIDAAQGPWGSFPGCPRRG